MKKFDEYVKKYAESKGISIEEAITHQVVKDTKKYYENAENFEAQISQEVVNMISTKKEM